jgi:hypothetical protein
MIGGSVPLAGVSRSLANAVKISRPVGLAGRWAHSPSSFWAGAIAWRT